MNAKSFKSFLERMKRAGKPARGKKRLFRHASPDIKAIRGRLKMSQREFALMIGVSLATVQNWEQGRREPVGPARALLCIAERNPRAVVDALHAPKR